MNGSTFVHGLKKSYYDCKGRLVAVDKAGSMIEPEYEPANEILQDP